jgi:hypothetical protein
MDQLSAPKGTSIAPARRKGAFMARQLVKVKKPGILRSATDELGVTTPKSATRPRRKGRKRVVVKRGRR